jgi:hypothetical protein
MGSIVSSIFGGGGGGGASAPAPLSQSQTDPYGAIGGRTSAASQLQSLMNDPSMALSMPGYQQTLSQGMRATDAAGASKGLLQSGSQNAALQGYGQNVFGSFYDKMYSQLGTLSGATSQTPAQAGQVQYNSQEQSAALQNQINQQNAQTGIFSTLLAGSALSKSGIFGGGSGGPFGFMSDPLMSGGDLSTSLSGAGTADSMAWIDYAAAL